MIIFHWTSENYLNVKAESTGQRCQNPAMKGKSVCYIHGGKSQGVPMGNQNALQFGYYTQESKAEKKRLRKVIKQTNNLIERLKNS